MNILSLIILLGLSFIAFQKASGQSPAVAPSDIHGSGTPHHYLVLQAYPTPLMDGDIIFIKGNNVVYAAKILQQTLAPEQVTYEYIKIGASSSPKVVTITHAFPDGLIFERLHVAWSGKQLGQGYVYLVAGHAGLPPRYEIGVPFFHGELKSYSRTVPSTVRFESLPSTGWESVHL